MAAAPVEKQPVPRFSEELEAWLQSDSEKTLGGLIATFGDKSFAVLFVLLLAVPALPLPTGGATHVMEIIAALLALELIAGRSEIWLPRRWRRLELAGPGRERFLTSLMRLIRRLEHLSRPRLSTAFRARPSRAVFGLLVLAATAAAFLAPPFSGLDTLPALGVVLLSLGFLLEDVVVGVAGVVVATAGGVLELTVGSLAVHAVGGLF